MTMPKVAAIQMCSSNILDDNLKCADMLLKEASINGADLVVLPEMFCMMNLSSDEKIKIKEIYGNGKIQDFLAEKSNKYNIWIVAGTIPISCKNPHKIKASCIVYDNKGNAVCRYDKIHLFDAKISENEVYRESETTEYGDKLVLVDTPIGRLGLSVCYDVRFPSLFTDLFNQGAEVISIPSAFTVKTGEAHWHILTRSRAIENFSYVIGACQGGDHPGGRKTYGHTLIIDPWGKIISERKELTPGIVYAEIDLKYLHEMRQLIPMKYYQKNKK